MLFHGPMGRDFSLKVWGRTTNLSIRAEIGLINFIASTGSCDPRRRSVPVRLLESQVRIPLRVLRLIFYICSILSSSGSGTGSTQPREVN